MEHFYFRNLSLIVAKCLSYGFCCHMCVCFCLNSNPDLDDWIYDCLLTSIAAVQAEDVLCLRVIGIAIIRNGSPQGAVNEL